MVMITSQFAALALAVSGATAAALPASRQHVLEAQVVPKSEVHVQRRQEIPVAPLPRSVLQGNAKVQVKTGILTSGTIVNINGHAHKRSGSGNIQTDASANANAKAQSSGSKAGQNQSASLNTAANVQAHATAKQVVARSPKHRHHHHHHHHHHHDKRDTTVHEHIHEHKHGHKHHHDGDKHVHKHVHKHSHRDVGESEVPAMLLGQSIGDSARRRRRGPSRLQDEEKRSLINIGSNKSPTYYYSPNHGSLIHVGVGKINKRLQATVNADVRSSSNANTNLSKTSVNTNVKTTVNANANVKTNSKRGLLPGQTPGPVTNTLGYLMSLGLRSEKVEERDQHQRRETTNGVEGVINIVSAVAGSSVGETIASLLLSNDPAGNNAFVLNASNSSATHVFLVPANTTSTASTTPSDGTIPIALHVPVYSPDKASMVDYCMTYDPNPPAPAPLTAQGCTDQVTDHQSQIFSYNPKSGVIVPMWTVSPSSTDPSAASAEDPATTASASASAMTSSATDSMATSTMTATDSAAPSSTESATLTSSAPLSKRTDDPAACADSAAVNAASTAPVAGMTPQDVTLIFTPSNAAGILPSSTIKAKDVTTFFPPGTGPSDDGNVGTSSAADDSEDDGTDDSEDDAGQDAGDDASSASVDPASFDDMDAASTDDATVEDEEVTPTADAAAVAPSPSMTPVSDASTPYSWMFTPQK